MNSGRVGSEERKAMEASVECVEQGCVRSRVRGAIEERCLDRLEHGINAGEGDVVRRNGGREVLWDLKHMIDGPYRHIAEGGGVDHDGVIPANPVWLVSRCTVRWIVNTFGSEYEHARLHV